MKNADATTTARLFVEGILCHHSVPGKLLSDRGILLSALITPLLQSYLCMYLNIKKTGTFVFHALYLLIEPLCSLIRTRHHYILYTEEIPDFL